ncbi:MAG: mechanosensitive ion channel family protein [Anaerolineales bacterium]
MPQISDVYIDIIRNTISSVVVLSLTFLIHRVIARLLRSRIKESTDFHTLRMLTRNTLLLLSGLLILAVWLGAGSNFAVSLGVFGAGIAFASQEIIGSFAGYLNIVIGGVFHIGDRIRVGDVVGDVVDIAVLRTTVMEIEGWVRADQYTGRMVTIANRMIFSDSVFNYTEHWPYLWDEIMLPVTYDSDWRLAGQILLEHGRDYTGDFQERAKSIFGELRKRYPLQETPVEPSLYIAMTDNWIEMTLRYVVDPHERRVVASKMHHDILQRFEAEDAITIASATFEVVGFPPLKGSVTGSGKA